ncbi:Uncharacterised protein family UPF0324,prokaryote [Moorella glycerini]|uniref:Sulfate exporter family transporter n=1 Tax=Neomoorella stamsii TaxID=1266720 RepID=A0A9X7J6B5_9FIRM|nr:MULTISPECIES: putative sulfate exporter family transporter [Moorella]PRR76410.1 hypothetical protein MOST_05780 [Moorella stamsii]CEP67021.1 Uncharacterised protein family UPF0324,prokaryote [Moorella glycerini]
MNQVSQSMSTVLSKSSSFKSFTVLLPGLTLAAAVAVVALYLGQFSIIINDVIIAIIAGALIRNTKGISSTLQPGLNFCLKRVLRLAIILLGMQLSFQQVVNTGIQSLLVIIFVVIIAIPVTYFIGRRLGLKKEMSLLIGVGSAICGATAVLATGPAVRAKERDIALAVGTIFIFNTIALIVYPIIGNILHLSDITYGTWTGVAVQDVSSVVATGFAYSAQAGQIATVVKLTRTVFIVPVVFLVSLIFSWQLHQTSRNEEAKKISYANIFPWFVLGFLLMAVFNSMGLFSSKVTAIVNPLTHYLILMVMAAVGADLNFAEMKKVGFNFLYAGLSGMLIMSVLSFALIRRLGI